MFRLSALASAALLAAQPATATSGLFCEGTSDELVSIYILTGSTPGFGIAKADITLPDGSWSTQPEGDVQPMVLLQASIAGEFVVADFSDDTVENVIASLRLVRIENDLGVTSAGVVSRPTGDAWPVICDFG